MYFNNLEVAPTPENLQHAFSNSYYYFFQFLFEQYTFIVYIAQNGNFFLIMINLYSVYPKKKGFGTSVVTSIRTEVEAGGKGDDGVDETNDNEKK